MGSIPTAAPDPGAPRRAPGDVVALREIWNGRVWYAWPAVVVQDDPNLRMLHVPPHARCRQPVGDDGVALRLPAERWTLEEVERGSTSMLSFAFPDIPYAVILGFDEVGALLEYYINLERPLTPSPPGFDTVDHLLDVTIAPDRTEWTWKDEDELREAVDRGIFSGEDAEWFRFWGERGVEHVLLHEPPFDREWSGWRPDPSWGNASLPSDWEAVPA